MEPTEAISRIKPTDVPLARMTDVELDSLVEFEAFDILDDAFRRSSAFRGVLANHTRLIDYREGDIIVREGDWGSTAYFIVSGTVVVARGEGLSGEILGRRESRRKGLFAALLQRWTNHGTAEYRDTAKYQQSKGVALRGESADARIYLQDVPAVLERCSLKVELGPGQLFGEIAALGRTARTATLIAQSDCQLLEIRWQGLRTLLRRDSEFRAAVDKKFRENALRSFLLGSPIFAHLKDDEAAMEELLAGTQLETYGEYDKVGIYKELTSDAAARNLTDEPLIATEGDHPNGLVMVRSGLARVSRRHHNGHLTISYLSPGHVYGFEEIRRGAASGEPVPLEFSLRAIGYATLVCVPTPLVEKFLLDRAPNARIADATSDPAPAVPKIESTELNQDFLEFMVQERLVNGTQTMLVNLDRCTRCDDCLRACASTHDGNPRFVRQGPIYDSIMVAHACMHCQDPVCMIECPTGAISRSEADGFVSVNDLTCVGCGTCSNNCPYDAIRMVEIRGSDGAFIRDEGTHAPIVKATKCDLCADQWGGAACERACPHDALVRIDMGHVTGVAEWKNQ
jgi:Fe-S-cluster-containing dehydrogenase component/CRP-like cAMP-binding protein